MSHVPHNAYDFSRNLFAVFADARDDMAANRIFIGKEASGERFVDHDHARRLHIIALHEIPSTQNRNSDSAEVSRAGKANVGKRLVGSRNRMALNLEGDDEIVVAQW